LTLATQNHSLGYGTLSSDTNTIGGLNTVSIPD